MISPEDILKKTAGWYKDVLLHEMEGKEYFPRDIKFGKLSASEAAKDYAVINAALEKLNRKSKSCIGYGYRVEYSEINTRMLGRNLFPGRIYIESLADYLKMHKKEKEFTAFQDDLKMIRASVPGLVSWAEADPVRIIRSAGKWDKLIEVCLYFMSNPGPGIYIREIPLKIPTKFIEENQAVIGSMLDHLIPGAVNSDERIFEKRYGLKSSEPLVRMNILDEHIAGKYFSGQKDITLPVNGFNELDIECSRVVILENKTSFSNIYNFLALPHMEGTIALFGRGFGVGLLKGCSWLKSRDILYWGDIDAHGFMILSQLRGYFPQVRSIMMDRGTFEKFSEYAVAGAEAAYCSLPSLTPEEAELYKELCRPGLNRLEQERIPHWYARQSLQAIL